MDSPSTFKVVKKIVIHLAFTGVLFSVFTAVSYAETEGRYCEKQWNNYIVEALKFIEENLETLKNDTKLHRRETRAIRVRRRLDRKLDRLRFICGRKDGPGVNVTCRLGADGTHAFGIATSQIRLCTDNIEKKIATGKYGKGFCFLAGVVAHEFGHVVGIPKLFARHVSENKDLVYQFGWFAQDFCFQQNLDRGLDEEPKKPSPSQPISGIVLYPHENYEGWGRNFKDKVQDLRDFGRHNTTSSIRVLSGIWVVCDKVEYVGTCHIIRGSRSNLKSFEINDDISSIQEVPVVQSGMVVYQHPGFGGDQEYIEEGESISDIKEIDFDGKISSLQIGSGGPWQLCEGKNFEGNCIVFVSGNVDDLKKIGWDNKLRSIHAAPSPPSSGITVYRHFGYGGESITVTSHTTNLPSGLDKKISSLQIGSGEWQLCEEKNVKDGSCRVFKSSTQDLRFFGWDNKFRSIHPAPAPPSKGITVYRHFGYGGEKLTVTESTTNLPKGLNKRISSLQIGSGRWKLCITLEINEGKCRLFTESMQDLKKIGWDNKFQSIHLVP